MAIRSTPFSEEPIFFTAFLLATGFDAHLEFQKYQKEG
jgi:hypothetical protein